MPSSCLPAGAAAEHGPSSLAGARLRCKKGVEWFLQLKNACSKCWFGALSMTYRLFINSTAIWQLSAVPVIEMVRSVARGVKGTFKRTRAHASLIDLFHNLL